MTDEVKGTLFGILERYGFATLVACVAMWVLRQDVLLPLVESHKQFVTQLGETQQDISRTIQEQTRLLYAMQPKAEKSYQTSATVPLEPAPRN
jgi:isopropylmalate/homocitrate/citramalate synthase